MPDVMSLQRWKEFTYGGKRKIRSKLLKAVDKALAVYHKAAAAQGEDSAVLRAVAFENLRLALDAWIKDKGPTWQQSIRNKRHAVEHLHLQLQGKGGRKEAKGWLMIGGQWISRANAEKEAIEFIEEKRSELVWELFQYAELTWRPGKLKKLKEAQLTVVASGAYSVHKMANAEVVGSTWGASRAAVGAASGQQLSGMLWKAKSAATDLIRDLVPAEHLREVMINITTQIFPDFLDKVAASCMPFVGVGFTGVTALKSSAQALRKSYVTSTSKTHAKEGIRADGPGEAVQALIRIMERERNQLAYEATVGMAEFGGKLAGTLADGGTATNTAIGLAASLAKLVNVVRLVVRDVQEKSDANKMMRSGDIDLAIFTKHPLVGCYLISCVDTSVLANMITSEWGRLGWMDDIELMKRKHIAPLQEQAAQVIKSHRFVIPSLEPRLRFKTGKERPLPIDTEALDEFSDTVLEHSIAELEEMGLI